MQKAYYNWTVEVHKNPSPILSPSLLLFKCSLKSDPGIRFKKITLEQWLAKALRAEVIAHQGGYAFKGFFFFSYF